MVQSEHSEIQSLLPDIMRLSSAQTRAGSVLALALNRVEQFAILNSHLSHFQRGLELLASGILSPALVSPADLHRALISVKRTVLELPDHRGLRLYAQAPEPRRTCIGQVVHGFCACRTPGLCICPTRISDFVNPEIRVGRLFVH